MADDKPLDKHNKLYGPIDKSLDTARHHHHASFLYAEKETLMGDDGKIDYERLDKGIKDKDGNVTKSADQVRKSFRDNLKKYHLDNLADLNENLRKIAKGLSPEDQDRFLKAFRDYDSALVEQFQNQYGSDFKIEMYQQQVLPRFLDQYRTTLEQQSTEHLEDSHLEEILKELDIEIEGTPPLHEVKRLLQFHSRDKGRISDLHAKEVLGKRFKGRKKKKT